MIALIAATGSTASALWYGTALRRRVFLPGGP